MRTLFTSIMLAAGLTVMSAQTGYQVPVLEDQEPMKTGAYEPTWESLSQYDVPEWFRDAKFGIWAHWGAQCVEGTGDWMARELYFEGGSRYKHHVENYGHPSEFGYKDILPLFKAENWDPDALVKFYKEVVGAEYFFILGNHHDNYDLWDSKYQEWNTMNIGPKRDVAGEWAAAAKKYGLPLGISFHADHAWTWMEPSRRYDTEGPMMGVKYDGWLTKEDGYELNPDGSEKWWKGLDPQDLYAQNHPLSEGTWANNMIHRQWAWGEGACPPSQEFVTDFYNRTLDAINRYSPDLIYFDVTVLPFYPVSDAGLKIAAHLYNQTPKKELVSKGENTTSVILSKILDEQQRKALVWDVERGAPNAIMPEPWQCCNCLGNWHYNTEFYEKGYYKSAHTVAKLLVDIVSKNGNMLLSVPLRADGTFDEKEEAILLEFGSWMSVNKESIVGTRPWKIFGEGPIAESDIPINAQGFNDGQYSKADSDEIRFNQNDKYLYVTALAWPEDGKIKVKSLSEGSELFTESIRTVELLGYGKVSFERTQDSLVVTLPAPCNTIMPVLKIRK